MVPPLGALVPSSSSYVRGNNRPFSTVTFDSVAEPLVFRWCPSPFIYCSGCFSIPSLPAIFVCTAWDVGGYLMPDQWSTVVLGWQMVLAYTDLVVFLDMAKLADL